MFSNKKILYKEFSPYGSVGEEGGGGGAYWDLE